MSVIHLVGPNAIGKTTAVRRWGLQHQQLQTVSLDLLRKPGYDSREEKTERVAEYRASNKVVVVESARTTQLVCISCDNGGSGEELVNGEWVKAQSDWKGDKADRKSHLDQLRSRTPIAIVESARTTTTSYAARTDPVIIVICPGVVLGKHLRSRCEAKGKKFRADYWTLDKLNYEASRRYLNFAQKNLASQQYRVFKIEEQERDWQDVDKYFEAVYQRLYNQLLEKQRHK